MNARLDKAAVRSLILGRNDLSDDEVKIALLALDNAVSIYGDKRAPERIHLTDQYGRVIHSIFILNGYPDSVYHGPKPELDWVSILLGVGIVSFVYVTIDRLMRI